MTLTEQRDIIQARIDHKEIECCFKFGHSSQFERLPELHKFNFNDFVYRIKPQPEPTCFSLPLSQLRGRWVSGGWSQWPITGLASEEKRIKIGDDWMSIKHVNKTYKLLPETPK